MICERVKERENRECKEIENTEKTGRTETLMKTFGETIIKNLTERVYNTGLFMLLCLLLGSYRVV